MAAAVGGAEDVKNLANYVLSLSGSPHDSVRAGLGKTHFTACAACHGIGGVGNRGARRAAAVGQHLAARREDGHHHGHHPGSPWRRCRRRKAA